MLIEESAYNMKRDRLFVPFIEEFTHKIDKAIAAPDSSNALAGLGSS
jgi:hypothetical protein